MPTFVGPIPIGLKTIMGRNLHVAHYKYLGLNQLKLSYFSGRPVPIVGL